MQCSSVNATVLPLNVAKLASPHAPPEVRVSVFALLVFGFRWTHGNPFRAPHAFEMMA